MRNKASVNLFMYPAEDFATRPLIKMRNNTNTTMSAVGDSEKSFSIVAPDSPYTSNITMSLHFYIVTIDNQKTFSFIQTTNSTQIYDRSPRHYA